ncbi:hypothetical protein D9V37_18990 [Nocardioides mangrovicus]|uniref:PH domain-containing protein n=1 Tax=Nocardioides mangrovicus TaxID=2478913 RepID=A0A3L8P026_9ACTN|nr:hypothetical protein [Nocardioides mangrovicus]RLV48163.1 hypothetical protein D9V37_18990 [Nocardioides mangrovicus]
MSQVVEYALAPRLRARLFGVLLVGLGVLLCVAMTVVLLARLSLDVMSAVVVLVLLVMAGAGWLLNRRSVVVRADAEGYRVRLVRGVGAAAARWSDVADVVTAEVGGARCVVLRLRDGRTTTVPVDVLAVPGERFVEELRARLARTRR